VFLRGAFPVEETKIDSPTSPDKNSLYRSVSELSLKLSSDKNVRSSQFVLSSNSGKKLSKSLEKLIKNNDIRRRVIREKEEKENLERLQKQTEKKNLPDVVKSVILMKSMKKALQSGTSKSVNSLSNMHRRNDGDNFTDLNNENYRVNDSNISSDSDNNNNDDNYNFRKYKNINRKNSGGSITNNNNNFNNYNNNIENNNIDKENDENDENNSNIYPSWDFHINRRNPLCSSIHAKKERMAIITKENEEEKKKSKTPQNPIKEILIKREAPKPKKENEITGNFFRLFVSCYYFIFNFSLVFLHKIFL
jgi:hypothetical protein